MTDLTDRLSLPLLATGQAQKEMTHNEALTLLDMLVQPVALSADLTAPPAEAEAGQCWIVPTGATAAWEGQDAQLAMWTAAGWRFAQADEGWHCRVLDRGGLMRFKAGVWIDMAERDDGIFVDGLRVLGARQPAIAEPAGGATIDDESRSAITAILAALRNHGLIAT